MALIRDGTHCADHTDAADSAQSSIVNGALSRLALKTAAANLAHKFSDIFGAESIERFLHTSYDQFACRTHRGVPEALDRRDHPGR